MAYKKYILTFAFVAVSFLLQGVDHDITITPEQACQILEESFLLIPHKIASLRAQDNPHPEKVDEESRYLQKRTQSLMSVVQKALIHSEEMRIFLKNYFMPEAQVKSLFQVYKDPPFRDSTISFEDFFYQEKIRRLSVARLLAFLKLYAYGTRDFPSVYEELYNCMIVSLAHKTFELNKRAFSLEIPTVAFNREVLFKSMQRSWQHYHVIKNDTRHSDRVKIMNLYRVYDLLCTMEGDLLDKDQTKEYQDVRKEVVDSLKSYTASLTPEGVACFFKKDLLGGRSEWCDEVAEGIGKLQDPSFHLEDAAGPFDNGIYFEDDYSECREVFSAIRARKGQKAYYHFLSSLYIRAQPNSLEKACIAESIQGRLLMDRHKRHGCDSIESFVATKRVLLSREMPVLPSLETVEKDLQKEIAHHTFNKAYHVGWMQTSHGFHPETCEVYKRFEHGQPSVHIDTNALPTIKSPARTTITPDLLSKCPAKATTPGNCHFIKKQLPWLVVGALGIGGLLYTLLKRRRRCNLKQPHHDQEAESARDVVEYCIR